MMNNSKGSNKKLSLKTGDRILTVFFFISMCLTVWGINIYRLTIIDLKYLFAVVAFGIIVAFVTLTFLIKNSYSAFWTFFATAGIGGGLFYFGLLFLNQQFADTEILTEDFQIVKTGTLARGKNSSCSQPFANIDFNGVEKQLVFYCDEGEIIKHSTKVTLNYSEGTFGFYIIKSKRLTD